MTITDADRAYKRIKERIVTIQMQPGSAIRDTQLMEELDLGRTPIREGLQRLQAESLVIVKPRRGMFVADITITDLTQIYEVRVELETIGTRLAAQRITPDQLEEMARLVSEYDCLESGDKMGLIHLDRSFHYLLAQASGNKFLQNEMDRFYNLSLRIWHLALNYIQPDDIDVCAHIDIFHAIKARDHTLAESRMRDHIEHFHNKIKQYL